MIEVTQIRLLAKSSLIVLADQVLGSKRRPFARRSEVAEGTTQASRTRLVFSEVRTYRLVVLGRCA